MGILQDKVALITGAAGALGRDTVRVFAAEGALVAGCDVVEMPLDQIVPDPEARRRCMPIRADVTTEDGATALVASAMRQFGRIEILVNIVGGWKGGTPVQAMPLEDWDGMLTLNLTSAFLTTRAVLPHMLSRRAGRIINISSRAAVQPGADQAAYNVAKAGVIALTQSVSEEVKAHGVTVNCVLPSILDTPANRRAFPDADHARWVRPADLARVLAFLASDGAAPISGAAIPVYGTV